MFIEVYNYAKDCFLNVLLASKWTNSLYIVRKGSFVIMEYLIIAMGIIFIISIIGVHNASLNNHTIHKSQGQTYKNVMCDIDGCFANGQAYVALSRCSSLEGLHLKNKITLASIKVDNRIVDFYKKQENLINKK